MLTRPVNRSFGCNGATGQSYAATWRSDCQLGDDFAAFKVPVHTNHRISLTLNTRYYFSSKLIRYRI